VSSEFHSVPTQKRHAFDSDSLNRPIEEQGPMESRKVWKLVADGIRTSDFEKASKEKSRIEVCPSSLIYITVGSCQ
jgi:hypothetical protein